MRIRSLSGYPELEQAVSFQRLIWGQNFNDAVPPSALWVALRTGGIVAGAFDEAGDMVGFLFGITGYVDGQPTHWSDMLAVHPAVRGQGVGRALKQFQRDTLLERGVHLVRWTFDPLESRNAYLNFARLGATAHEYIPNCYGTSNSPLHAGLATDRLVAFWQLTSDRVRSRMDETATPPDVAAIAAVPLINGEREPDLERTEPRLRLQIPSDIQALKAIDLSSAVSWRASTRAAFLTYFGRGYAAVEYVRDPGGLGCYVLERTEAAS